MKIGINLLLWTDKPTIAHKPLLDQIKKWGFDGVEFPVLAMEQADARALGRYCEDHEMHRSCLVALSAVEADPSNPDPRLRQAALAQLKSCIEKTRDLGGDILVGPFHQGLGRFTGSGPTKDEWRWSAEIIRKAGEYAASMHVDLAIEPLNRFEMFLTNTMESAGRFVKEVDLPNVGILADTHHSNIEEDRPHESWSREFKQIRHVHISESNRGVPGRGHACTQSIFQALRRGGYNRWMTIEAFGLNVPSLIQPLHLWRSMFLREEEVAVQGLEHIRDSWDGARG
jgi:D-psicose/D-tagatose/L-ribulose 3-epimerase